jgi:AP-2 complex subunit alpha
MQRWKSLKEPDGECQEVMKLPPTSSGIDEGYMDQVANMLSEMD